MRPVQKGESPYESISEYKEALPYLESRLGPYCSYCELPLYHAPEVEHVSSKKVNPELKTVWSNLLLGCKYCNTRKKDKVISENVEDYMWPDTENTALAFSYPFGVPTVNEEVLNTLDDSGKERQKATNLFDLLKLGNEFGKADRRVKKRNEVYEVARQSLENWKKLPVEEMKGQITFTAVANGFFSIWMTVFKDEPEMLRSFMDAFPGTEAAFFDENGNVKLFLRREECLG